MTETQADMHECAQMEQSQEGGYGAAIDSVWFDEDTHSWCAGNGEYGSQVWFCPFCGQRLETQAGEAGREEPVVWGSKWNEMGILDWSPTVYCEELGERMTPEYANALEARIRDMEGRNAVLEEWKADATEVVAEMLEDWLGGHEFDEHAAARGPEMGCATCYFIDQLRALLTPDAGKEASDG